MKAYPAPWGEFTSARFQIGSLSSALRSVADPAAVMDYWDKASRARCVFRLP